MNHVLDRIVGVDFLVARFLIGMVVLLTGVMVEVN